MMHCCHETNLHMHSKSRKVASEGFHLFFFLWCTVAHYVISSEVFLTLSRATKYTALLGSLLGGSMPTSAAIYGLLHESNDFVKLCAFSGITLGVLVIYSGLMVGLLGTTNGAFKYTKIATIAAVSSVLVFLMVVLCTAFDSYIYKVACGVIFPVLVALFLVAALWYIYQSW